MTRVGIPLLLVCALTVCAPSEAKDPPCLAGETINDCIDRRVIGKASELQNKEAATEEVAAAGDKAAKDDQAGSASAGAQTRSTVTDLIPWANMLGLLSDSDASDGTVAVDFNFLLPTQNRDDTDRNSQLKWAIDVSPEPFEPLVAAIAEDVRNERAKELDDKISDTGDSELQFTYSIVNDSLGRDFRRHEAKLASLIAAHIRVSSSPDQKARLDFAKAAFHREFQQWLTATSADPGKPLPAKLTAEQLGRFEEIVEVLGATYTTEMAQRLDEVQSLISQDDMSFLTGLVLQQPQLLFAANKKFRDELVGPESWGAKVTYERSFVSLTHFLKKSSNCMAVSKDPTGSQVAPEIVHDCFKELQSYKTKHAEDIENESRWAASLEYKKVDSWQYVLPADSVALDLPKYDRLIASIGFGRAVRRTSDVKDRLDFEAAYDSNLDDDDNYKSRFVVTLTYTRRFGEMDIPFSIVYANRSEFLEGTDQQIGLHVGLKYRALD